MSGGGGVLHVRKHRLTLTHPNVCTLLHYYYCPLHRTLLGRRAPLWVIRQSLASWSRNAAESGRDPGGVHPGGGGGAKRLMTERGGAPRCSMVLGGGGGRG